MALDQSTHKETKATEPLTLEQQLDALEAVVLELERGDLNMEKALAQFEKGVALSAGCQQQLKQAEQKVWQLTQNNGEEAQLTPFVTEIL